MLKNIFWLAVVTGLTLGARSAWGAGPPAARPPEVLDLYYVMQADYETASPGAPAQKSGGGKGYGAKVMTPAGPNSFLHGEYQKNRYDELDDPAVETDVKFLRAGFGISSNSGLYGLAEYIEQKIETPTSGRQDKGYGVHLGYRTSSNDSLAFVGQAGYVDVGDFGTGVEYLVGAAYAMTPALGLFADYRNTQQTDDLDNEITFADIRVGLRFKLGG